MNALGRSANGCSPWLATITCALGLLACTEQERSAPASLEEAIAAPEIERIEAAPWREQLERERAMGVRDARLQPRPTDGGSALTDPAGSSVLVDAQGGALTLGGVSGARLRVSALGRESLHDASGAAPRVVGPEVRRAIADGITEWWRALPSGLEHGLTLARRPEGDGPLVVDVEITELTARTLSEGSVALLDTSGTRVASYTGLLVLDARQAEVPAWMRVVDGRVRIEVDDAGARYPLVIDPLVVADRQTIVAPGAVADDSFGFAVAMAVDGSRALVGRPFDDTAGFNSGAAHVYVWTGTSWAHEVTLTAFDAAAEDYFGVSVAVTADASRAFVGVRYDDAPGDSFAGSVRVFVRSGTTWIEEATLTTADAGSLGLSVACSADGTRVLAGVPARRNSSGTAVGGGTVFVRSGSTWTEEASITGWDRLGDSAAMSGDGTTVALGAPNAGLQTGEVVVYARSGSTWTLVQSMSGQQDYEYFGYSVALDATGQRLLVGWPDAWFSGFGHIGAARVWRRVPAGYALEATLRPATSMMHGWFGVSVALTSDGSRALIGHVWPDSRSTDTGRAHVFARAGTTWTEETILAPPDLAVGDRFGKALALSDDGTRALVGAPDDVTAGGARTGSLRAFALMQPDGAACVAEGECASGFCVDGVCCVSACGGGATNDCQACSAAAGGTTDGTCTALSVAAAPTITCRPALAPCDVAEVCSPGSTLCPSDLVAPASTECRAAAGPCDPAEVCTGISPFCPADARAPAGTECRPASGACDVAETCTGASAACPPDAVLAAGTACRAAAGVCDVAESCTGSSAACPADFFRPATTTCRGSAGVCDAAETCTGAGPDCPPDAFASSSVTCRPSAGVCDVAESCTGSGVACPADARAPTTTVCRPTAGECDLAETCDGASAGCPPNALAPSTVTCRPSAGVCDVAESCTGTSAVCPPNAFAAASTVCRASGGVCDVAESCTGASSACPADGFASSATECRPASGACDAAERCTGASTSCPADVLAAAGTECRPSAGACDVAEACTGASAACPTDALAAAGTECRASAGTCDVAESCTGTISSCPADGFAAEGTSCGDSDVCDGDEVCASGSCVGREPLDCDDGDACTADSCDPASGCASTPLDCDDGDACTADSCDPASGCASTPIDGCCTSDAQCDDGDACTSDACGAANECEHAPVADCADGGVDAGTDVDAAAPELDATVPLDGGAPPSRGGCGCRAGDGSAPTLPLFALVALVLIRRWRRAGERPRSRGV